MSSLLVPSNCMKDAALAIVLQGGANKVLWDECHPVWDSLDLLKDSVAGEDKANTEQMAIFGVRGKFETPNSERRNFQIRYTVDFKPQINYRILVAVWSLSDEGQVSIIPNDLPQEAQEKVVREAVKELTDRLRATGFVATVKSFMRPDGALNGQ